MSNKTLNELVRKQILMEGPQICDERMREDYIDSQLNELTNVELLERISAAQEQLQRQTLDHVKCWL